MVSMAAALRRRVASLFQRQRALGDRRSPLLPPGLAHAGPPPGAADPSGSGGARLAGRKTLGVAALRGENGRDMEG